MRKVVVIVGPTGVGKSELGIALAKKFNGEIISGDSVQVYKRLDIGSAKIIDDKGVKHHLIDILNPGDKYSVYDFQQNVREKIKEIKRPIIVGGTGLYIKAALYNYEFDGNERNDDFANKMKNLNNEEIYNKLTKLDSGCTVDKLNRVRLLRAYEMALKGENISKKTKKNELLYNALVIYLDSDRASIYEKINKRVDRMIDDGLVMEAKQLYDNEINIKAIGYSELNKYFANLIDLEEAIRLIKRNTRRYAKRQITWFKNQMNCVWIDILDNPKEKIYDLVRRFYGD